MPSGFNEDYAFLYKCYCFYFLWFFSSYSSSRFFQKVKNKLRTIEPRFPRKVKNNPPSFWKRWYLIKTNTVILSIKCLVKHL